MKNKPDPALLRPSNLSSEIGKKVPKSRETIPLKIDPWCKSQKTSIKGKNADPDDVKRRIRSPKKVQKRTQNFSTANVLKYLWQPPLIVKIIMNISWIVKMRTFGKIYMGKSISKWLGGPSCINNNLKHFCASIVEENFAQVVKKQLLDTDIFTKNLFFLVVHLLHQRIRQMMDTAHALHY
jgi:hypothetical protein